MNCFIPMRNRNWPTFCLRRSCRRGTSTLWLSLLHYTNLLRLTAKNSKVKCFSLHPGLVRTEVTRNMSAFLQIGNRLAAPIMMTLQKTPEEGAYCSVHVATSPELNALAGGEYFIHGEPAPVSKGAQSDADAARLWEVSEKLTGFKSK